MTNAEKVQAAKEHGKKLYHRGARGGRIYDAKGKFLARGWLDYYDRYLVENGKKSARKPKKRREPLVMELTEPQPEIGAQPRWQEVDPKSSLMHDLRARDLLAEITTWYCDLLFDDTTDPETIKGLLASDLHPLMVRARNLVLGRGNG